MLEYEILKSLRGLYEEMRTVDIKPDFSAAARQYDIVRHTAAEYWKEEKVEDRIIEKPSLFDQYFDVAKEKQRIPHVQRWHFFFFLIIPYARAVSLSEKEKKSW